jgi:hypothetical protein
MRILFSSGLLREYVQDNKNTGRSLGQRRELTKDEVSVGSHQSQSLLETRNKELLLFQWLGCFLSGGMVSLKQR